LEDLILRRILSYYTEKYRRIIYSKDDLFSILLHLTKMYTVLEEDFGKDFAKHAFEYILEWWGEPPITADPDTIRAVIEDNLYLHKLSPVLNIVIDWLSGSRPVSLKSVKIYINDAKRLAGELVDKLNNLEELIESAEVGELTIKFIGIIETVNSLEVKLLSAQYLGPRSIDVRHIITKIDELRGAVRKVLPNSSIVDGIMPGEGEEVVDAYIELRDEFGKIRELARSIVRDVLALSALVT
jgi:hypothetical protein